MDPILEMSDTFKLLGDKTRLTIIALLKENELCVCDIVDAVGISQPGVSQHLRKLKQAGLVHENRKGQWIYYSLNKESDSYIQDVFAHLPSMKDKLQVMNNCCD